MIIPGRLPPERLGTRTRRIGTVEQFRLLGNIVRAILVLNVFDALATLMWVYSGQATEANPMMEYLVHEVPVLFVLVKFTLVFLGSWLLWIRRKNALAVVSIFVAFLAYYGVVLYHLHAMDLRLLQRLFE